MQVQRSGNHRRTYDDRSCPPVVEYTTENECVKFHGISEGEECTDDLRSPCKLEVKVWKPAFLGRGLLCINRGIE